MKKTKKIIYHKNYIFLHLFLNKVEIVKFKTRNKYCKVIKYE